MSGDSGDETDSQPVKEVRGRGWNERVRRALVWLGLRSWWRTAVPRPVRLVANRAYNRLMLIRQLEREKAKPAEEQDRLVVPPGEWVELPMLWVAELYSPSHFHSLERALTRRSWPREPGGGYFEGRALMERIRRTREQDNGFVGLLGRFLDVDASVFPGFDLRRENLPDGIEWIEVHAFVIAPAITAVVATCRLYDTVGESLNVALRMPYQPRLKDDVLSTGRTEGIAAVQEVRGRIQSSARKWLAEKMPGIFATEGDGSLPLLDLLLTHKHHPIEDENSQTSYIRALGLSSLVWSRIVSPGLPEFKLDNYQTCSSSREADGLWTLAANYASAFTDQTIVDETGQQRSAQSIGNLVDPEAQALLVRLAISEMIDLKSRQMNRSRDLSSSLHNGSRPVASLKRLRKTVLANSIDLDAIAAGLASFAKDRPRYEHMVPELWREAGKAQSHGGHIPEETEKDVLAKMATWQSETAQKLVEDDSSLMQMLGVAASLTSSLSGIRMQRWAMTLSVVSLFVAGAAAVFAYMALKP